MNFMDLANIRQSDRTFTTQKVERAELLKCLQAAQTAPSARNLQPWKFIILDDPELVQQAAAIIAENKLGINKFAQTAPVLVAVVEEPNSAAPGVQTCALPISNGHSLIWAVQQNISAFRLQSWV